MIQAINYFSCLVLSGFVSFNANGQNVQMAHLQYTPKDTNLVDKNKFNSSSNTITSKALLVPGVFIVYGFSARISEEIRSFDHSIKKEVWDNNPHSLFKIDNYLQFAPAAAVYALNLAGVKGKNNLLDRTMIYVLINGISALSVESLKYITKIQRPDGSTDNSFPSGHTATAFAAAEFLRQEYKNDSPWYGIAGYTVASITGYLRIYNNRHWFSDVIEGAGIGIISTRIAYWLYPQIKQFFKNEGISDSILLPEYQNGVLCFSFIKSF